MIYNQNIQIAVNRRHFHLKDSQFKTYKALPLGYTTFPFVTWPGSKSMLWGK